MNDPRLQQLWDAAASRGLVPEGSAIDHAQAGRPWPVVLLTALGAWLAALPLLGVVGMLLGPILLNPAGPYIVGVLCLAGAVVVLRGEGVAIFVEQLAVVALVVGGGSLAAGLFRHLPDGLAAVVLATVALSIAAGLPRAWMRLLLGVAAGLLITYALLPGRFLFFGGRSETAWISTWAALHVVLAGGLGVLALAERGALGAARLPWLASICTGWLVQSVVALAVWSGVSFLVAGTLGGGFLADVARGSTGRTAPMTHWAAQAGSVAFALAGLLLARRTAGAAKAPQALLAGLVLAALAWFMPALGGVLLALAVAGLLQRWRLAGLAALAAVWILGAFYYQLRWPLATKALVLVAAGVALAGIAAWAQGLRVPQVAASAQGSRRSMALVTLAALATLAVANLAIWQKEDIIAQGQKIYVRLAPVDPRSLMQGDFMRLNYAVPAAALHDFPLAGAKRPYAIARLDARGVAEMLRIAAEPGPLAAGELAIELTPKDGRWILVTDAWFFREGTAERWQAAKFGEFRVAPGGQALLVGLADEQLQPMRP